MNLGVSQTYSVSTPALPGLTRQTQTLPAAKDDLLSLDQIKRAAERIAPYIKDTPTISSRVLSERFGTNVYLKLELLQNTGAFKVRGAFNKMLSLDDADRERGIVAVSAGNHAKAVAFAARTLGRKALILMPGNTPENYLTETKNYGAEVRLFPDMTTAFEKARELERSGYVYVHPFDDELVVAGQGTIGLEILRDVPKVTDVVVSVGGGGLSGGVAAAIKALKPEVNIWGVETKGADSMSQALTAGKIVELPQITSIARTLGAPSVGKLPFELAKKYLSGVTVVNDDEAVRELFFLLEKIKVMTEPAASCTVAAVERLRENFGPDRHVVMILCGGSVSLEDLFSFRQRLA